MTPPLPWQQLAAQLAHHLADKGALRSAAWRAAIEDIPRHVFTPRFYFQQPDHSWSVIHDASPDWLPLVYADEPLITNLADTATGGRVPVSSSTKPSLMVRMLEALNIEQDHTMLEIGTGTGYNLALLAHRLGSDRVCSVDISHYLVATAKERLADLGYLPAVAAGDGRDGFADQAPFDRIIATCSVRQVPQAWAQQTRVGGTILVDLKMSTHAGNLVRLSRFDDRLEGRFLPDWAGFMAMRHSTGPSDVAELGPRTAEGPTTTTRLDPLPWKALVPWFLAHATLPEMIGFGYRGVLPDGQPEWATFTAADGSWCDVAITPPDDDRSRVVRQGGPTRIWDRYTAAHTHWCHLSRPGWDRLGLTVTDDGRHTVWLDLPESPHVWSFPQPPASTPPL